jgi:rhodanese-related sulfurtransferase
MSEKPGTTIGFERRFNRLLGLEDRRDFVRELTGHLAPQPPNFKRIVELNKGPLLTEASVLDPLAPARVKELVDEGVLLLDGRSPREFDAEHLPGSVNVTMTRSSVGTRAAWIADPERDVLLNAAGQDEARRFGRLLEAVGFRKLAGFLAGGTAAWREAGYETGSTVAVDVPGLAAQIRNGEVRVLDVRDDDEWEESHVPGSVHIPFHALRDGVPAELENGGKPIAIVCSAGNRSSIAASLLKRAGLDGVEHVADGGVADLRNEGIELVEGK